jgi:hypothetical protein
LPQKHQKSSKTGFWTRITPIIANSNTIPSIQVLFLSGTREPRNNWPEILDSWLPNGIAFLAAALQCYLPTSRIVAKIFDAAHAQRRFAICCIAELHSAERRLWPSRPLRTRPADCKSAIQQNRILRYGGCGSAELCLRVHLFSVNRPIIPKPKLSL